MLSVSGRKSKIYKTDKNRLESVVKLFVVDTSVSLALKDSDRQQPF